VDELLSFFSDLILFTAGLVVVILWIALFIAIGIEIHDAIIEHRSKEKDH